MPLQQPVDRRSRHRMAHFRLIGVLDFVHVEHPTRLRLLQEGFQQVLALVEN